MQSEIHSWLIGRYGFSSADEMSGYFGRAGLILDAGCGAGLATSAWMRDGWPDDGTEWVGVDISQAVDVARKRLGRFPATNFVQADLMRLPFAPETFDVIFSEGVLHHTPSTQAAFNTLVPLLKPGGEIMIYVYRKKSPVREFTDDYIRGRISDLPPDEAWKQLESLTDLAHKLAGLEAEIELEEDVPLLGIPAGRHNVQRLIYWHMAKLFWNEKMTFEENTHVNFDWYHPHYAHRQTEAQVREWYAEAGVDITHLDVDNAGFTVRGIRR
jgi:SAM-dependent methyltransferase